MAHACDRFRLVRVEAGDFAAEHWTADDARDEHIGTLHVDSEDRFPINLFGDVQTWQRLTEQAEVFRIF